MKNKKKLYAVSGLAALAVVGGTFAYFNASQSFANPFTTTSFEATSVEKFNPTDGNDWKPGAEVNKEIKATNTGKGDVFVRVKFDEVWGTGEKEHNKSGSESTTFFPAEASTANQENATDGLTANDGSVVYKNLDIEGWTLGKDGYYYFNTALTEKESTNTLLNSVTLCGDTDMGLVNTLTYYKVTAKDAEEPSFGDGTGWTTEKPADADIKGKSLYTYQTAKTDESKPGYSGDNYTLNITTEFIQADQKAATDAKWEITPAVGTEAVES